MMKTAAQSVKINPAVHSRHIICVFQTLLNILYAYFIILITVSLLVLQVYFFCRYNNIEIKAIVVFLSIRQIITLNMKFKNRNFFSSWVPILGLI